MNRKLFCVFFAACSGLLLLGFVGVERIVDHETGIVWEPFIKHCASPQVRFADPSRQGLETVPFESLDSEKQRQFIEFCDIRYGIRDPTKCYAMIAARKV
jgi:hypothetical protein